MMLKKVAQEPRYLKFSGPSWARSSDPLIMSQVL